MNAREKGRALKCKHPPTRLYAYHAADGTLCVCCCDCGSVLRGAIIAQDAVSCRQTGPPPRWYDRP